MHGNLHAAIAIGLATGLLQRVLTLYRRGKHFPASPHNLIIHFFLGFIASVLGSLAAPALVTLDFTAGVFLAIGTAQFHTVRSIERQMLIHLESDEIIPRGGALIETVTAIFEARNYMVLGSALVASAATAYRGLWLGIIAGLLAVFMATWLQRFRMVGDLADIGSLPLRCEDGRLWVGDHEVLRDSDAEFLQTLAHRGMGLVVEPRAFEHQLVLTHPAQRQAMMHLLAARLGVAWEPGHGYLKPEISIDPHRGTLYLYFAAARNDEDEAVKILQNSPVLIGSPTSLIER